MSHTTPLSLNSGFPLPNLAPPSQVFVPVRAVGPAVLDNGGDTICMCFTPELAQRIADLINADAR